MSSPKLRRSCSLLLSILNLLLLLLSSASLAPLFILRTPPTLFGWALFAASATALVSSLLGLYSHTTTVYFITHISLLVTASIGDALGFLSLLLRPDESLRLLGSARKVAKQMELIKIEEWMLVGMFAVQLVVLVFACALHCSWLREYEGMEAEREAVAGKRKRRTARVHGELVVHAVAAAREMEEKIRSNYGTMGINLKDRGDGFV